VRTIRLEGVRYKAQLGGLNRPGNSGGSLV
jgi:hypothetical protein